MNDSLQKSRSVHGLLLILCLGSAVFCGYAAPASAKPPVPQKVDLQIVSPLPRDIAAVKEAPQLQRRGELSAMGVPVRVLLYWGGGPVKVSSQGKVRVNGERARTAEITLNGCSLSRMQKFEAESGLIKFQGTAYRGWLEAYPLNGKIQVINVVDLEDYLRGVVPKELLGTEAELEAVKAQAVLARTYALAAMAKRDPKSNWDLRDDTGHQVYGGAGAEHPVSDEAVRQTSDLVLTYEGRLCAAVLYHSTCGGHTESNANVYGTAAVPYLHGVSCGIGDYTPENVSSKKTDRKASAAGRARRRSDPVLRPNTLAERRAYNNAGNVYSARGKAADVSEPSVLGLEFFLGTDVNSMANRFRYASGKTKAWCSRSSFACWEACWTPEELGQEVGQKLGKSMSPITALDVLERTASGRVKRLRIRFADGTSGELSGDILRNTLRYRNGEGAWCTLPSTRFEAAEINKKVIRLRGTGWGHGIGLCQWGAKELARQGYDASKILNHYYMGTAVVRRGKLGPGSSGR